MSLPSILKIDRDTGITLGTAVGVALMCWTAYSWAETRFRALEERAYDRFTCTDHRDFVYQLQIANPRITIPSPKVCER